MKALLYKEFKLAMHPICYLFIFAFPLMILIPSYPLAIGFIYVLTCYPILFLGANKGQQSNDLLFSTLLPVRKKDIVLARIITVGILQVVFIAMQCVLYPLALKLNAEIPLDTAGKIPGIGLDGFVSVLAIAIIGYAIADLVFFPIYYRRGKSIVASTLFMILGFVLYLGIFTIAIPYIPGCEWYMNFLSKSGVGVQFIVLGVALIIYALLHLLVYHISSKELEKVDF